MMRRHGSGRTALLFELTCPVCSTRLTVEADATPLRFRCERAHSFGTGDLLRMRGNDVERGLQQVVRGWETRTHLLEQLVEDARRRGCNGLADAFSEDVQYSEQRTRRVRDCIASIHPEEEDFPYSPT